MWQETVLRGRAIGSCDLGVVCRATPPGTLGDSQTLIPTKEPTAPTLAKSQIPEPQVIKRHHGIRTLWGWL